MCVRVYFVSIRNVPVRDCVCACMCILYQLGMRLSESNRKPNEGGLITKSLLVSYFKNPQSR